jgi:hypothetical protein
MPLGSKMDAHLLVEGENDLHVISALCQKHQVPETFDILHPKTSGLQAGGVERLLENFRLQLLGSAGDTTAIGVVLDADDTPDKRWRQITSVIEKVDFGYVIPEQPDPTGSIIPAGYAYKPRTGTWLMPNNVALGELEDFVTFLIPSDDKLSSYANNVLDEIEQANLNLYKNKRSKAFIHTWLAWQEEPGLPMGRAITAKALSADPSIALTFVGWLNRLFNP